MAAEGQIHELSIDEVFVLLRSRSQGLAESEADVRRHEVGLNQLDPPVRFHWAAILSRHLVNFFSLLLDFAAVVCFLAESIQPGEGMGVLGYALLGVSLLNSLFAFAQEARAERAMEELRKFLPQTVRVRRDGLERELAADQLVPGYVVILHEGDRIPADARLVAAEDLLVNNAPLTGESRSQPMWQWDDHFGSM